MKKLFLGVIICTFFSSTVKASWVVVATKELFRRHYLHFRISDSEAKAQELAIEACEYSSCAILYKKQDTCLAGTVGLNGGKVAIGEGNTIQKAQMNSMSKCREINRGHECEYAGYGCSTGSFRDY